MSIVANLDLNVRADTKQLDAGLTKGEKSVKDFGKNVGKAGKEGQSSFIGMGAAAGASAVAAVAAFAGVTLSVKAVADAVTDSIGAMDALGRTSKTLGIGTQTLAALQLGGEMAGVGVEAVNGSLASFTKNMNEAGMGAGPSLLALRQLGLRGKELAGMRADEALGKVAEAMKGVGNAGDRMRLAQALGVSELMPMLDQGKAGIDSLRDKAREMGLGDPAAVKASQEASRAWREFKTTVSAVFGSIAGAAAPVLTGIAKSLADVGGGVAKFIADNRDFLGVLFDTGVQVVKTYYQIHFGIMSLLSPLGWVAKAVGNSGATWEDTKNTILKGLFTVQFYLGNWKETWANVLDHVKLKLVGLGNDIVHLFKKVIPDAIKGKGVNFDREETEWEKDLKKRISERGLKGKLEDFIKEKMQGLENKRAGEEDIKPGDPIQGVARKVAAMEFGSKEAFSTIYGTEDSQKKALNVANDQLKVLREMLQEARKKANRRPIVLKKADL